MHEPESHEEPSAPGSGLLTLAIAVSVMAVALLVAKREMLPFAASLYGLILLPASLASAVAVYGAWRIRPSRHRSWLAASLTILAAQAVAIAVTQIAADGHDRGQDGWARLNDLLAVVVIAACCAIGTRRELNADPFSIGVTLGTALGILRVATVTQLPALPMGPGTLAVLEVCFLAVLFVAALAVGRQHGLRKDVRIQLIVAGAMIGVGQYVAAYMPRTGASAVMVLFLDGGGGVVVTYAALGMLRRSLTADRNDLADLELRFWRAEEGVRQSRAQLHEVNATLAGISSASRLIRDGLTSGERRRRLEEMMDEELARLARLLAGDSQHLMGSVRVSVDDLVATVVTAHDARGHMVRWRPTGAEVIGRRDDVYEVLNILLDNAVKHGAGPATVEITEEHDGVEITVRDQGCGIAPGVDVFAWGERGPASMGQGIGLHIARELMEKQGGYLRLQSSEGAGATFVLGLPTAKERVGDSSAHV